MKQEKVTGKRAHHKDNLVNIISATHQLSHTWVFFHN